MPSLAQRLRSRILARLPSELEGAVRKLAATFNPYHAVSPVLKLEAKLWSGFSARAQEDLLALIEFPGSSRSERTGAALTLAAWYFSQTDYEQSLRFATLARSCSGSHPPSAFQVMLEADSLTALKRHREARQLLVPAMNRSPNNPHLRFSHANALVKSTESASARLGEINSVLGAAGLEPVELKNSHASLTLDNICVPGLSGSQHTHQPLVSIILPTFRAEKTLETTLDCLLAQTWTNLELIAIDDCSDDRTPEIIRRYAAQDSRIRPVLLQENGGTYAARNHAARLARGQFLTVHDADDWSHPRKIEAQAKNLLTTSGIKANLSQWIRADDQLQFIGSARPTKRKVIDNASSLMLTRELFSTLDPWDNVRAGADSEFIERLEHQAQAPLTRVYADTPLSFGRVHSDSLTQRSTTHVLTRLYGARRCYLEAARHQLRHAPNRSAKKNRSNRRFPAPAALLEKSPGATQLDLLLIGDSKRTASQIPSLVDSCNGHAGFFSYPVYEEHDNAPLPSSLLSLAADGKLLVVYPEQRLHVRRVLLLTPSSVSTPIDRPPHITASEVEVVVSSNCPKQQQAISAQVRKLWALPCRFIEASTAAALVEPPRTSPED